MATNNRREIAAEARAIEAEVRELRKAKNVVILDDLSVEERVKLKTAHRTERHVDLNKPWLPVWDNIFERNQ